jgi:ketosteroid isomerase-like protein
MSQENVDVVRRVLAHWERGYFADTELINPDVRIVWLDVIGGSAETVGFQEARETLRVWLGSFDRVTMSTEQLIDAGDKVVVVAVWRGVGKTSRVETEWRFGAVWTIRDGEVVSVMSHPDPSDALAAAGLSE